MIYLHIGAMKTGTTYLQDLMWHNRAALLDAGVLLPGRRWADQDRAVRDVLGFSTSDPRDRALNEGMWRRLAGEMLAHRGTSVLSMEFLSFADPERAAEVVSSLEGADVHVVLTVRDAVTALPAQWQTACRTGARLPFRELIRGARHHLEGTEPKRPKGLRMFQRTQDIPRMLDVWVPLVGRRRVHVITVPPRGSSPRLLWERFAGVVGVDPALCVDLEQPSNTSLGHTSSELLRRLNVSLGRIPPLDYARVVKGPLARRILSERSGLEPPVRLDRPGLNVAARWNERVREAIQTHRVQVVGDLDELPVTRPGPDAPADLFRPSDEELLAAAATAYVGLARLRAELEAELDEAPRPAEAGDAGPVVAPEQAWSAQDEPVTAAVDEIADLVRACVALKRRVKDDAEGDETTSAATEPTG